MYAQAEVENARSYVVANVEQQKLTTADINGLLVSSAYRSPIMGWYHVYFNQSYQAIEIYNRLMNVVLVDSKVAYMNHTFISSIDVVPKVGALKSMVTPVNALQKAIANVGLASTNLGPIQELTATKLIDGMPTRSTYGGGLNFKMVSNG